MNPANFTDLQANAPYSSEEIEALRKRAWDEQGVLIVSVSEPLLCIEERNWIISIGERLYGDRGFYEE